MTLHPFEPARLISGVTAITVGAGYGLDALGLWHAPGPWLFFAIPAGLFLSGITAAIWATTRRHRLAHGDGGGHGRGDGDGRGHGGEGGDACTDADARAAARADTEEP